MATIGEDVGIVTGKENESVLVDALLFFNLSDYTDVFFLIFHCSIISWFVLLSKKITSKYQEVTLLKMSE